MRYFVLILFIILGPLTSQIECTCKWSEKWEDGEILLAGGSVQFHVEWRRPQLHWVQVQHPAADRRVGVSQVQLSLYILFQWSVPLCLVEAKFTEEIFHTVSSNLLWVLDWSFTLGVFHSVLGLRHHPPHKSVDYLPNSWHFTSVEFFSPCTG